MSPRKMENRTQNGCPERRIMSTTLRVSTAIPTPPHDFMWRSQNGSGKTMGDGRRDPKKPQGKGSKRTESNIEYIQQMLNEKEKEKGKT
jgi:hypothetical protein